MIRLILYDYDTTFVNKNRPEADRVAAICVHLNINENEFVYTKWLTEEEYELIEDQEFHDNVIDEAWKTAGQQLLPLEVTLVRHRDIDDEKTIW